MVWHATYLPKPRIPPQPRDKHRILNTSTEDKPSSRLSSLWAFRFSSLFLRVVNIFSVIALQSKTRLLKMFFVFYRCSIQLLLSPDWNDMLGSCQDQILWCLIFFSRRILGFCRSRMPFLDQLHLWNIYCLLYDTDRVLFPKQTLAKCAGRPNSYIFHTKNKKIKN